MISLKNRQLKFARFHAGVSVGPKVLNSVIPGQNGVEHIELVEGGVGLYVRMRLPNEIVEDVIGIGNILSIRLKEEEPKEVVAKK